MMTRLGEKSRVSDSRAENGGGYRSTLSISIIRLDLFKAMLGLFVQFGGVFLRRSREISLGPSLQ